MQRLQTGIGRGRLLVDVLATAPATWLLTNEVQVTMTYMGMMRRMPDPAGFAYWVARLDQRVSINDLASLFQFSDEYVRRHAA